MRLRPLVLVALLAAGIVAADDGWQRMDEERGIVVDARDVAGSGLHEVRATAHADAPPAAVLAVLWAQEEYPKFLAHVTTVRILEAQDNERLLYEQLAVPFAKDRDVVLRVRRRVDATTGVVEITSTAVTDTGPPPTSRFVRVRVSDGHWRLVPAGGGTDVTYTNRTDAAGFLPDWIVNRIQKATVPDLVRAILDRAAARR